MPHIDEGTLHALLDGALRATEPERAEAVETHIESCAECRTLADEAADLRGRAGEILGVLEPGVAPDFDEVLVRAGAAGAAPRGPALARQARWTRGLAWAATIVIALGTGYLIRDRLVPERAASFSLEAPAARNSDPSEMLQGSPAAARPELERSPEQPTRGADGAADAPAAAREEAEAAEGRSAVASAPPPPSPAAGSARPRPGADDASVREGLVPVESAPDLRQPVEQEPVAFQDMVVAATPPAPGSRIITPEEAGAVLDGPFLVLPRAEVTLVTVEPDEHGEVVVSFQRLSQGVVIRVTQRREREPEPLGRAVDAHTLSAAPAAPMRMRAAAGEAAGTTKVRVRVSGAELELEGALPRDALELLGGAAAPYARPR